MTWASVIAGVNRVRVGDAIDGDGMRASIGIGIDADAGACCVVI
jgi:hypothetical protein